MRASIILLIPLALFMLLVDTYTYRGIAPLIKKIDSKWLRKLLRSFYWSITIVIFLAFTLFMVRIPHVQKAQAYVYSGHLIGGFLLFYLPKLIFILFVLMRDIIHGVKWIARKLRTTKKPTTPKSKYNIPRSQFLYQVGLIMATIPFASLIYGMTEGKFDFRLLRESLRFPNLPSSFRGLKIVQISDIHLGSLNHNFDAVKQAVSLINKEKPDLILFTGDLVNNFAQEIQGWIPILGSMKATMGKYSILGNHDYGDYSHWKKPEDKILNLNAIKAAHADAGFRLLLNQSEVIRINGESIALMGIENWGRPPFPQYGDLKKTMKDCKTIPFKILMSHDPHHWDAQVLDTNIDLTFSGHTHGMQFGIEKGGLHWSPVQYKYPRWGGLYQEGEQYLYVNRGFGYIGFPGRVGMPPEITVMELL